VSGGHVQRGNDLEPLIESWIRENRDPTINSEVIYDKYDEGDQSDQIFLQHPGDERLAGHPDGIARGSLFGDGERIWEIKVPTSYSVDEIRRHGLPSRYKFQVQWYMHIANQVGWVDEALVCVWDCDAWGNPIIIEVPRDEEIGEELEERAKDLLFAVKMGQRPASSTFGSAETTVEGDEDMDAILREYQAAKAVEKRLKEERKRLKAQIVTFADGAETIQTENNLARLKYNHGRYDATYLSVTER